jgi:endonuclease YncB( thermonuclease family)
VIDGDTVSMHLCRNEFVNVDLGFKLYMDILPLRTTQTLRLFGINAPETRGVADRGPGLATKIELERLLNVGKLTVETIKPDKYGDRYLGVIRVTPITGEPEFEIGQRLVETGFAKPYLLG